MSTRTWTLPTLLLMTVTGLNAPAALAEPLPGFTLAAETPRVSYYTRAGLEVDVERTERYLSELEKKLGVTLERRAQLFRHDHAEHIAAATGQHAAGLTQVDAGLIHSTEAFHAHELVHWVAGQIGDPGPFFQEGLAVVLGDGGRWRGRRVEEVARWALSRYDLGTIMKRFREIDPEIAYPVAGAFVKHLVDEHGLERVVAFFRASADRSSAAARLAALTPGATFHRSFGTSLDQALVSWSPS